MGIPAKIAYHEATTFCTGLEGTATARLGLLFRRNCLFRLRFWTAWGRMGMYCLSSRCLDVWDIFRNLHLAVDDDVEEDELQEGKAGRVARKQTGSAIGPSWTTWLRWRRIAARSAPAPFPIYCRCEARDQPHVRLAVKTSAADGAARGAGLCGSGDGRGVGLAMNHASAARLRHVAYTRHCIARVTGRTFAGAGPISDRRVRHDQCKGRNPEARRDAA